MERNYILELDMYSWLQVLSVIAVIPYHYISLVRYLIIALLLNKSNDMYSLKTLLMRCNLVAVPDSCSYPCSQDFLRWPLYSVLLYKVRVFGGTGRNSEIGLNGGGL